MSEGPPAADEINPRKILDLLTGLWKAAAVKAALELDLFTQIALGHCTVKGIAAAVSSSERGTAMLLDALSALGLLRKDGSEYQLSPDAEAFLSRRSPKFIENIHLGIAAPWEWEALGHLADAVREGRPNITKYMGGEDEFCLEKMVLAIGTLGMSSAAKLCDLLGIGSPSKESFHVLDVACGTGVYGFSILQRMPAAVLTSVDRRQVIKHALRIAQQMGVAERVTFRPGNIFSLQYPENRFDLVLISNVLHQYSGAMTMRLFEKAFAAVKQPHGMIVVHDFVADDNRSTEMGPLLMSLDMLLYTADGDVHTFGEYKTWLKQAGFRDVRGPMRVEGNLTSIITGNKS